MASYDYVCPFGNEMVTITRGMTEDEVVPTCDNCGSKMTRVYVAAPVKFNASGFYSTGG
jgi:predicted nucleic acid-binding Zn ribbon protein